MRNPQAKKGGEGECLRNNKKGWGPDWNPQGRLALFNTITPARALGQAGKVGKGWILQEPRGQKREPMLSTHRGKPRKGFKPRSDRSVRVLQAIEQFCPEK